MIGAVYSQNETCHEQQAANRPQRCQFPALVMICLPRVDNARDQERDREENCCPFIGSVKVVAIVNICSVRHNCDICRVLGSSLSGFGGARSHSNRGQVASTKLTCRWRTDSLSIGGLACFYTQLTTQWPRRPGPHHLLPKTTYNCSNLSFRTLMASANRVNTGITTDSAGLKREPSDQSYWSVETSRCSYLAMALYGSRRA